MSNISFARIETLLASHSIQCDKKSDQTRKKTKQNQKISNNDVLVSCIELSKILKRCSETRIAWSVCIQY